MTTLYWIALIWGLLLAGAAFGFWATRKFLVLPLRCAVKYYSDLYETVKALYVNDDVMQN